MTNGWTILFASLLEIITKASELGAMIGRAKARHVPHGHLFNPSRLAFDETWMEISETGYEREWVDDELSSN